MVKATERSVVMTEYDLFVPLFTEDGKAINQKWIRALKKRLFQHFGGVTYFPQRNEGLWRLGRFTFRDKVVIFRVLSNDSLADASFWKHLKGQIKEELKQHEVLIVSRKVRLV